MKPLVSSVDRGEGRSQTEKEAMCSGRQTWERRGDSRCSTLHKVEEAGRSCPELQEGHSLLQLP